MYPLRELTLVCNSVQADIVDRVMQRHTLKQDVSGIYAHIVLSY
jgi:hypothetical protein